jgi:hypothetical protein
MATCRLCKRESAPSSTLCEYHLAAKRKVEAGYKEWSEGYGGMAWKEYLLRIRSSSETGLWAKEVADMMSKDDAE